MGGVKKMFCCYMTLPQACTGTEVCISLQDYSTCGCWTFSKHVPYFYQLVASTPNTSSPMAKARKHGPSNRPIAEMQYRNTRNERDEQAIQEKEGG